MDSHTITNAYTDMHISTHKYKNKSVDYNYLFNKILIVYLVFLIKALERKIRSNESRKPMTTDFCKLPIQNNIEFQ